MKRNKLKYPVAKAPHAEPDDFLWDDMIQAEPRLERLYVEIVTTRDLGGPCFCAEQLWARRFKSRLAWLVGCYAHSDDPRMRTMAAYDIAFEKLYTALPPCRGCACVEP